MPNLDILRKPIARRGMVVAILAALGMSVGLWRATALATPPKSPPPKAAKPVAAPAKPPGAAPQTAPVANADAGVAAAPVVRDTARIAFATTPPANATVMWGRKSLGMIGPRQSLVVVRPRDSGPLDVIIRAPGYLPVQVRAHTFSDSRVVVKLTTPEQKNTLIGYRAPIDAGPPPLTEDGGMPVLPSEVNTPLPTAKAPVAAPPTAASH